MPYLNELSPALTGDIQNSEIVVAAGRGLIDINGFLLSLLFAEKVGAQLGGTRGAVDLGWIDSSREIGMSGLRIAPKLYIGFGVSGTNFHTAGMRRAETVIAVNTDHQARIFEYADVGIYMDSREVLNFLLSDETVRSDISVGDLISKFTCFGRTENALLDS